MPLISVLIPTFNSEKYIANCIKSIIGQKFNDYEIIIKDGLSSDSTLQIISGIKEVNPYATINAFSEKDEGIYDAMNQAIAHASGKWMLFLGSDDELYNNDVLLDAHAYLKKAKAKFIYGNVLVSGNSLWAKNGEIYDGEFNREKLAVRNICHQAIFYERTVFDKIGYYNTQYTVSADWDFNHRCFAAFDVQYVNIVISRFNAGGLSTRINTDKFIEEDMLYNLKRYYGVNYYNRLFKSFSALFVIKSRKSLQRRNLIKSIYFFTIAFRHTEDKFGFIKNYLLKVRKMIF